MCVLSGLVDINGTMDNSDKSKVNEFKASMHSSRSNNSNYLQRSASKNNVPSRKGIYSTFLNKSTASSFSGPARVSSPRVVLQDCGYERDNDGFAIPARPVHHVKSIEEKTEDMKKQTILAISDFMDNMPELESFYLLKRVESTISEHVKKTVPQNIATDSILEDKELDITNWLQNNTKSGGALNLGSTTSTVPVNYPHLEVAESASPSVFPGFCSSGKIPISSVYNLKNWTLVKGHDPMEVILQGDLYNMHSQDVIEENHVSSKVINAEGSRAQTFCCIYNLIPPFHDRKNCIPSAVKRYFEGGKFPKNWIEIINMWHLLNVDLSHPSISQEEAAGFSSSRYDNERTPIENERMSIRREPSERDGVLSEREERILADQERRRVLAERESNHWPVQEAEEEWERERECRREEEDRETERRHQRAGEERERERHLKRVEEERERKSDTENKRQRVDLRKRIKTPIPSKNHSVVGNRTRSAQKGRRPDPFLVTPKSSKVNKYKARRQTPGLPKGWRVTQDDTNSFSDSDIQ